MKTTNYIQYEKANIWLFVYITSDESNEVFKFEMWCLNKDYSAFIYEGHIVTMDTVMKQNNFIECPYAINELQQNFNFITEE